MWSNAAAAFQSTLSRCRRKRGESVVKIRIVNLKISIVNVKIKGCEESLYPPLLSELNPSESVFVLYTFIRISMTIG